MGPSNCCPLFRIYSLEQEVHHRSAGHEHADVEQAPLLDGGSLNTDAIFRRALDAELEKICSFYQSKEAEIFTEVEDVLRDAEEYAHRADTMNVDPMSDAMIKGRTASSSSRQRPGSIVRRVPSNQERRHSAFSETLADDDDDDADSDDEPGTLSNQYRPQSHGAESSNPDGSRTDDMRDSVLWGADSRLLGYSGPSAHRGGAPDEHFSDPIVVDLYNAGLSLKKRAVAAYVSICGLKSYIQLNKTGFSKALKKYDKILDRNLRREYVNSVVSLTYPFKDSTMEKVDDNIRKVEEVYANVVTTGNIPLAKRELRLHLREHVVWERNTVWREMIGIERKAQAANVGIRRTLLGGDEDPSKARRQGDEQEVMPKMIRTPFGTIRIPQWLCSLSLVTLVLILLVFGILLSVPIMEKPEQQNCLAMLVFVSLLWATEVGFMPCVSVHRLTQANFTAGYSSIRHIATHSFPRRDAPYHVVRQQASRTLRPQGSHRRCFQRHVDASHHAVARWLHHRCGAFQVRYRSSYGHVRPE